MADKKEPKKTGRHSKQTPSTEQILVKCISKGMSDKAACFAACIRRETFYRWLNEDSNFNNTIQRARAAFVQYHVDIIHKAAKKDWKASGWALEHREEEYARRQQIQISQAEEDPWTKFMSRLTEPLDGRIEHAGQDPDTKMEPVAP